MKKLSKKIMIFLFGSKYPIFNKKGKIEHSREDSIETWKKKYKEDPTYNWRNHTGLQFEEYPPSKE